jgi:hypothetical protein
MPVDVGSGQVSTADALSPATQIVRNWQSDAAGVSHPRPGLATYATTGLTAPLSALYRWKAYLIGVDSDRKIWALPDAAPTVWTALSDATAATQLDGALRPVFAEDPSDLFIVGGGDIQKWTGVGLTARLGAGPQASHIVNLGQRLIANDLTNPSRVYFSDLGDGSDATWQALSFGTAEARPDPIVAVSENTAELILRGSSTLETWVTGSDPLIPFERVNTLNVGCGAPYSEVRYDGQAIFLDERRRFVASDGRSQAVISEAVERDLRSLGTVEDCHGFRDDSGRLGCLVWVFPTEERTFEWCYSTKKWGERNYYTAPFNGAYPVTCHAYWPRYNLDIVGALGSAAVYQLDNDVRTDLDGTLLCERITGAQDFGTRHRKRSAGVQVTMRRGTAPFGGVDAQLEVAVADDGKGWSDFKTITTGQPGDYDTATTLYFGGVFRHRRYWLRYSGSDDMSLVSLQDDVTDLEAEG